MNDKAQGLKDKLALEEYKKTINRIDDWFEYMNESKKDREFIHEQLDNLTERLTKIYTPSDKLVYAGCFGAEEYYECDKHKVPYPKGAVCPQCEREQK